MLKNCDGDREVMRGEKEGACDTPTQTLKKMITLGLYEASNDPDMPEALWSPAYDVLANFQISHLQYGQIFQNWFRLDRDDFNFANRQATCQWVIDNLDMVKSFVPKSFPRSIEKEDFADSPLVTSALAIAGLVGVLLLLLIVLVFAKRNTRVIYFAQIEFLSLLLVGSLLVVVGALLLTLPPTSGTCVATVWLTNIGYAVQLVPLAQRTFAINKLANIGKQMQRVRIRATRLFRVTGVALCLVGAFLAAWTVIDPPTKSEDYDLTTTANENGDTVVILSEMCASESDLWLVGSLSWQALVILPSLVVSIVVSRVTSDINDTKYVAATFVVHTMFLALRASIRAVMGENNTAGLTAATSLLLSFDMCIASAIYIVPKLCQDSKNMDAEILPDLFLETTVMIADIEGFTAWSSVREPIQVFKFLEALFENFAVIAERYKIYQVDSTAEYYGM